MMTPLDRIAWWWKSRGVHVRSCDWCHVPFVPAASTSSLPMVFCTAECDAEHQDNHLG